LRLAFVVFWSLSESDGVRLKRPSLMERDVDCLPMAKPEAIDHMGDPP